MKHKWDDVNDRNRVEGGIVLGLSSCRLLTESEFMSYSGAALSGVKLYATLPPGASVLYYFFGS